MLPLSSIKFQAILLIAILVIVPALLIGGAGILYYRDVVKNYIWDTNLVEAKAISALSTNYVDLAQTYLKSVADRPLVIKAVREPDVPFLDYNARYIVDQSDQVDSVFFTDGAGTIISSYPYTQLVGQSYRDRPYVRQVLSMSNPAFSKVDKSELTGKPVVYLGIPIVDDNTTVGTLVGTVNLTRFRDTIANTQVKTNQYVYLVNKTGRVMVHSNATYMDNMTDFTVLPAVANVIGGQEGVLEQDFPFENDRRLVAYSPVAKYGWGVIVATPLTVAYSPIDESTRFFIAFIAGLLVLSLLIAIFIGQYLTDPILKINNATTMIPDGNPEGLEQYLPVHRKDELGNLARSFLSMAGMIQGDRERAISARNQAESARAQAESEKERAEEEKNRAELYLDIMGHDINNLNQVALGNLDLIRGDSNLTPDQIEIVMDAYNSVKGSASIIDNVRKIQAITEKRVPALPEDLNDLIQGCIAAVPRPENQAVTINYTPRSHLMIKGTALMKEVFSNLINNSIKHSGRDVTIDIGIDETTPAGKKIYNVSIADNGPGIPDSLKPKLFNRFQRGETQAHGKGLGLFIVKSLVEQAGGDVVVTDRVPGDYTQGAKFIVSLPACEECR